MASLFFLGEQLIRLAMGQIPVTAKLLSADWVIFAFIQKLHEVSFGIVLQILLPIIMRQSMLGNCFDGMVHYFLVLVAGDGVVDVGGLV